MIDKEKFKKWELKNRWIDKMQRYIQIQNQKNDNERI